MADGKWQRAGRRDGCPTLGQGLGYPAMPRYCSGIAPVLPDGNDGKDESDDYHSMAPVLLRCCSGAAPVVLPCAWRNSLVVLHLRSRSRNGQVLGKI